MLIDMQNIYKIFGKTDSTVTALDGINLQIDKGEFVSIIGKSGSGKSTLMNIMGCLDTPSKGNYFFNGENVSKLNDLKLSYIRNRQIGFIFQGFNLIPSLTAIENVELPLIYRGMAKEKRLTLAKNALEKVGLENRLNHLPCEMSGGQQQRVAIARAIASSPPLILADEPTGNLDSKSGVEVMDILMKLNHEGRTIVLITHDNSIAQVAKRTVRIQDGLITQDYEQIKTSPLKESIDNSLSDDVSENIKKRNDAEFNQMLKQYLENDK